MLTYLSLQLGQLLTDGVIFDCASNIVPVSSCPPGERQGRSEHRCAWFFRMPIGFFWNPASVCWYRIVSPVIRMGGRMMIQTNPGRFMGGRHHQKYKDVK